MSKEIFSIDKQGMLEQIEVLNKEVTYLKSLIKAHKDVELNDKRNFNKDKQDMLKQIEELKNEVTDLKSKLQKSAAIGTGDLFLLCHILKYVI